MTFLSDLFTVGSFGFELAKGIPAIFATVVIGLIAADISRQQKNIAKAKLSLDLFERRLVIFQTTWDALTASIQGAGPIHVAPAFSNSIPEARFLFGEEIEIYMTEITRQIAAVRAGYMRNLAKTDNSIDVKLMEAHLWLEREAKTGCKIKFGKYLDFSNWR